MRRILAGLAVVVLSVLGVGVVLPAQVANAVSYPVPPPVNVLPSVLTGASSFGPGGLAFQTYMAKFLGQFAVTAQQQAAITASAPTPAQTATVADLAKKFKVPAFKIGSLVKGAGTVGLALMAKDLIVGVGHGVTEMFGIDVEGNVCGTGSSLVAFLSSVDCGEWRPAETFVPNEDALEGWTLSACSSSGWCVALDGRSVVDTASHEAWGYCLSSGASVPAGVNIQLQFPESPKVPTAYWGAFVSSTIYELPHSWYGGGRCDGSPAVARSFVLDSSSFPVSDATLPAPTPLALRLNETGHPAVDAEPVLQVGDPDRLLRCQITLSNGSTLTAETATFKETDEQLPAVNCPNEFPPELSVTNVTIWEVGGGQTHELYNEDTTPEYQAAAAYPECSGGACLLDLRAVETGVSCFQDPVPCADWFESPTKADDYTCWYGTHSVSLGECGVYAPSFKPEAKTSNAPYGDPLTGEPLPNSNPENALDAPLVPEGENCWGSAWGSFNPLEWVMVPVMCAWQWAMVPSPADVAEARETLKEKFDGSPPGKITAAVSTVLAGVEVPTGCEGVTVDFSWVKRDAFADAPFPDSFRMLQACPGDPLFPWAVFSSLIVGAGMVVIAFRTVPALLGRIFTYGGVDG